MFGPSASFAHGVNVDAEMTGGGDQPTGQALNLDLTRMPKQSRSAKQTCSQTSRAIIWSHSSYRFATPYLDMASDSRSRASRRWASPSRVRNAP